MMIGEHFVGGGGMGMRLLSRIVGLNYCEFWDFNDVSRWIGIAALNM